MIRRLFKGIFKGKAPGIVRIAAPASSGGGSANDATIAVAGDNPAMTSTDRLKLITLTNANPLTPAVVELDFTNNMLRGVSSGSKAFDGGTAASPSYVIDYEDSPRTIYLERSGSPAVSNPSSTETVKFNGNSGEIQSNDIIIEGNSIKTTVALEVAAPSIEFAFDSMNDDLDFLSTGSVAGILTNDNYLSSDKPNPSDLPANTVDNDGWSGHANGLFRKFIRVLHRADYLNRSSDRSVIMSWRFNDDYAQGGSAISYGAYNATLYLGMVQEVSSVVNWWHSATGVAGNKQPLNNTFSHTGGGSSETLEAVSGKACILVISYNKSAQEVTLRWKQTGHGAGHSYVVYTGVANEGASSSSIWNYILGTVENNKDTAYNIKFGYYGICNAQTNQSSFEELTKSVGLWS